MTAPYLNRVSVALELKDKDHLEVIAKASGLAVATVAKILLTRALHALDEDDQNFAHMLRFAEREGPRMEAGDALAVPASSAKEMGLHGAPKQSGARPGRGSLKPSQARGGASRRKKGAK